MVFEGVVLRSDGAPEVGAVVVSSAGGKRVTELDGSYRLEVEVPFAAERVQITATTGAGDGATVHASVAFPGVSWVEPLLLGVGDCQPRWSRRSEAFQA